jgi:hypothetical protein
MILDLDDAAEFNSASNYQFYVLFVQKYLFDHRDISGEYDRKLRINRLGYPLNSRLSSPQSQNGQKSVGTNYGSSSAVSSANRKRKRIVLESRVLYVSQNLCGPLEGRIHFLNQAIEMEVGDMLREFIGSEEHDIRGTPDTGESQIEPTLRKR